MTNDDDAEIQRYKNSRRTGSTPGRLTYSITKEAFMSHLVEMCNITKKFPGVTALDNISFTVDPGEVHVLLGENGAGKSTLMKILSGMYVPTEGHMIIKGKTYPKLTPAGSQGVGISIIYQELSVVNELSIQENIFLGRLLTKKILGIPQIDNKAMREKTLQLLEEIGLNKAPETPVRFLSISEKQMVEIAKAVAFNSDIIIMDEPTSSLTNVEIERLFTIIRKLREEGRGIVYISHKLSEVMEVGDRVTVLKDGGFVGTKEVKDVDVNELISMMVGRKLQEIYNDETLEIDPNQTPLFEVKNLTRKDNYVRNVSFQVHEGEILGFAGLVGSGRSELMNAIYGAVPIRSGEVFIKGKKIRIRNTYHALKNGIALITENRRETGFFHNFSIKKNITIAKQLKSSFLGGTIGLIRSKEENEVAKTQREAMQIKCSSLNQNITQLSGGNQQKVILGKWLASEPKVIIFDEPTKGIDVGTKSEFYRIIRNLAKSHIGVVVVSSELPELLALCDRIIVFADGEITAQFPIGQATEEAIVKAATVKKEGIA